MTYPDDLWELLVRTLAGPAEVSDRAPYGLVVRAPRANGSVAEVEIVMTRDEWVDMATVMWGDPEAAAQHVRDQVLGQSGLHYLVYGDYRLTPSATEALPVDPKFAKFQRLAEQHPNGIPGGAWHASGKRPRD